MSERNETWGETQGYDIGSLLERIAHLEQISTDAMRDANLSHDQIARLEQRAEQAERALAEESARNTKLALKIGWYQGMWERVQNDWCDQCDALQWVLPNGDHDCKSVADLRTQLHAAQEALRRLEWRPHEVDGWGQCPRVLDGMGRLEHYDNCWVKAALSPRPPA